MTRLWHAYELALLRLDGDRPGQLPQYRCSLCCSWFDKLAPARLVQRMTWPPTEIGLIIRGR